MAQYAQERAVATEAAVANPIPLGLSALAFTTAIIGCFFAHFILPVGIASLETAVGSAIFYGGIVQILAGMWEFRKDNTIAATLFSAYGGFLVAFGVIFIPGFGIFAALSSSAALLHGALGLLFLCWTIFGVVLFLGALRANLAVVLVLLLMVLAYLFLTIGYLSGGAAALLVVGGWLAIICAIVAWYTVLASILATANGAFRLPM